MITSAKNYTKKQKNGHGEPRGKTGIKMQTY